MSAYRSGLQNSYNKANDARTALYLYIATLEQMGCDVPRSIRTAAEQLSRDSSAAWTALVKHDAAKETAQ